MDSEIARNQDYDDHYADDGKDIHPALLPRYDMITRGVLARHQAIVIATA
jgi:hypothetical protein